MIALDRLPDCVADLPDFTGDGVLPVGDYAPSRVAFEQRFVTSAARTMIYAGWNRHRTALLDAGLSPSARQLLNGSYTESKAEPGDIDLIVAIDTSSDKLEALSGSAILELLHGPEMKHDFMCDAYPLFVLPEHDPLYAQVTLRLTRYWTKWFGTTRANTPKGRVWATTGGLP
jgi:hypothetical protein